MLHNTGPYGPNETPVNMSAPVNMNASGHMNIVSNHLAKLGHGNAPTPSSHYGLGDYAMYHQPYNMTQQMGQYPNQNLQHLGYQHNYSQPNSGGENEANILPMNLNVNNDNGSNSLHYPYDKRLSDTVPDIVKEQNIRKIQLNIPQIPNKSLGKPPIFNNDYLHNDSFHNPNHNLDLSMKTQERVPLTHSRRKKIENTVKLIENILINSTNLAKEAAEAPIERAPSEIKHTAEEKTKKTPKVKTVTNEDPLSLTLSDSQVTKQSESITIPITTVKAPETIDNNEIIEHIKPVQIKLEVTEYDEDEEMREMDNTIEIKVEKASWTDTDYSQPFFRDCHAFQRDDLNDCRLVEGETSVNVAKEAMNYAIIQNNAYECPHCCLIFKNPKRFLVHSKWHTFGLTNEKRTELMKEREAKRNQRREAKIIERMNSKEVTTTEENIPGKTFPCKDCDKVFSAKGSLKNHRQRTHPTRIRECRVCHKSVVGWIALRNHMATHAGEAGVGFQCSECPKRFKYSHSLAKHSDTHLEKIHACTDCPKKFGSLALLKMHSKTHERHSRGATFSCTYCAKAFFESYSLQVHERTHRNERPYLCEICNTSFGTNSSLKRHLKVSHSTSKPFECQVCHRSFSTESIRDRHEQRQHAKDEDFKFPCKLCKSKYLKLKDLQKHIYKAHPKNKRRKKEKSDTEDMDDSE